MRTGPRPPDPAPSRPGHSRLASLLGTPAHPRHIQDQPVGHRGVTPWDRVRSRSGRLV